jgi:ethanolamine ammonia-lyase large subunit
LTKKGKNMRLTPLTEILVPDSKPDSLYKNEILAQEFCFLGLKELLGKADYEKAGDRGAHLTGNDVTREAARSLLSSLTLQHLYDNPLTDDNGNIDTVMRVNYDIDLDKFHRIASMTISELKDHLMKNAGEEIKAVGRALTGVMAAALTKVLDTHELVYLAQKISNETKARTLLGKRGTLSSRLQPNHPTDDLSGMTLLMYTGLSMGAGDALLGVNPSVDTVENLSSILHHLDKIRRETGVPTQICVLGHIKTQLACLEKGAPVEIMFQSLAGTDKTNIEEFDITVDLLDHAYQTMLEKGMLKDEARQFMYFETGQGSEFSYGKHNGIDMATTEALCYGLARRYDPFMVNNVTGFIGPETHRSNMEMIQSNLQDHFMGKLLGLPMGMAPCYTLHSEITLEGQQIATQLLTAAGANFYMDVYLNTDRMLAYFDTSGHDDQTLREIYGKTPAFEYLEWAKIQGIFTQDENGMVQRGPNWGNFRIFCGNDIEAQELIEATPAIYGFDNAGPRPTNEVTRTVKFNQAIARQAIYAKLQIDEEHLGIKLRHLQTQAQTKEAHLNSAELGSRLTEESRIWLKPQNNPVQIVISDGLSAEAVHHNIYTLLPIMLDGFTSKNITTGIPILVPHGRVKLVEQLAEYLKSDLTIMLIGERPGGDALASRSLSAYFALRLAEPEVQKKAAIFSGNPLIGFEYTVISNIYSGGIPPIEAGSVIVEKAAAILTHKAAGNRLKNRLPDIQNVGLVQKNY